MAGEGGFDGMRRVPLPPLRTNPHRFDRQRCPVAFLRISAFCPILSSFVQPRADRCKRSFQRMWRARFESETIDMASG